MEKGNGRRSVESKLAVYLRFSGDGGNSDINLHGENFERVNTFKYLGSTLAENGDLDAEMTHMIQSGCITTVIKQHMAPNSLASINCCLTLTVWTA